MKGLFKNLGLIIFITVGIVIIGIVIFFSKVDNEANNKETSQIEVLSSEEVSDSVMKFINQNLLGGVRKASLVDILEKSGLYKIKFTIEEQDNEIDVYASLDGKLFFPDSIDLTEIKEVVIQKENTIGGFFVSDEEICRENEKPIIYFFGSEKCGFCKWEHPIMEKTALKFGGEISFHNNMDSEDDRDIFNKYSSGGIPTMVFGCKYYKTGAGQANGEDGEEKNLTALICKLTNNKPANICEPIKDLIGQIKS